MLRERSPVSARSVLTCARLAGKLSAMRIIPIVLASVLLSVISAIARGDAGDGWTQVPPRRTTRNAKRMIFVCDAGDKMVPKIETLRKELIKTTGELKPDQSFNVIFMRPSSCAQLSDQVLPATAENQEKLKAFVNQFKPGGNTDPIPAIDAAFKQRPDLIFLLGDHLFLTPEKLLAHVRDLNKDHQVTINTIAFVAQDEPDFFKFMRTLADQNSGLLNVVRESDLKASP